MKRTEEKRLEIAKVANLISDEYDKDYGAYMAGQMSREDMYENLIERRKILSLVARCEKIY